MTIYVSQTIEGEEMKTMESQYRAMYKDLKRRRRTAISDLGVNIYSQIIEPRDKRESSQHY